MDLLNRLLDFIISGFFFYEERRVNDANREADKAKLGQQLAENKNEINEKFSDMSDIDMVNDAIRGYPGATDADTVTAVMSDDEDRSESSGKRTQR